MQLEEYLEAIDKCPDEFIEYTNAEGQPNRGWRLAVDYGICDNLPIYLGASREEVRKFFSESDYTLMRKEDNTDEDSEKWYSERWNYNPGTAIIYSRDMGANDKGFKSYLMLHTYQGQNNFPGKKMESVHWLRPLVFVVQDLGRWVLKEKILFCLPESEGWRNIDTPDSESKIVFYNPSR